jgi:hypothetical protein
MISRARPMPQIEVTRKSPRVEIAGCVPVAGALTDEGITGSQPRVRPQQFPGSDAPEGW